MTSHEIVESGPRWRSPQDRPGRYAQQDDAESGQGLEAALRIDQHIAQKQDRGGDVEQRGEWIPPGAVRARQVRLLDSQHEDAGDRQQVEQVGSEDHIGEEQIVQRRFVELIPGSQDRPQDWAGRRRRPRSAAE